MAIVTFLEVHKQQTCNTVYAQCKPFPQQVTDELNKLYATAFASSLNDNVNWVGGREIGGAFHLAMLAVKQLSYELSGLETQKPIAMEVSREINLVELDKRGNASENGASYKRRVDIILKGEAANDTDYRSDLNIWVEVKSVKYQANYLKKTWKEWNMKGATYSYHRQFYLDRVGATDNQLKGVENAQLRLAKDFEWWMQDFKRKSKSRRGYKDAEMAKIATQLRHLPTGKSSTVYASLGYDSAADNNAKFPKNNVTSRFRQHNIKNWLINDTKAYLLDGIDDETINELITASEDF
ncbi:hypothetical protein [Shewanella sp. 10N.286.48.A6]|uniref:hypothetical protein n=1 Tax=Shewanella sp. 10N.286.48.A6 TaxID=1880833 RepID=UPI0010549781|nr:hypothetical protein [Shewanella sp. 10N.286.48.A6]